MLRLRTLGAVALSRAGHPLVGRATQRRRLALLALLGRARAQCLSRDRLLAYLWPERATEPARHSLSQTLYELRRSLDDAVLVAGIDEVRLNPDVLSVDVVEFERAIAAGDDAGALALYGGPFLDGFHVPDAPEFEQWADAERDALAATCAAAIERLAFKATGGARADLWRRRAAMDPLDSRVAFELVRAIADTGDRAGALRHARLHETLLRTELALPADPRIAGFVRDLRSSGSTVVAPDRFPVVEHAVPEPALAAPPPAPVTASREAPVPVVADAVPSVAQTARVPRRAPPAEWHRNWRRAAPLGAALALLSLVGTMALARRPDAAARTPGPPLAIVVGSMRSSDAALGLAVREAVLAELGVSARLRVLDDAAIRSTLELMRARRDTVLDIALATEVAQRRAAPLVVSGSVQPAGGGVLLSAQLLDASTGATLVTLGESAATSDEVVPAVARLARALRRHALRSGAMEQGAPLPAVTTSSIEALRAYALARRALGAGDRRLAIAHLETAVGHDADFALAHYMLGDLLWYVDQQRRSDHHLGKAFALVQMLPPREQYLVRARYEQLVLDRPDSALGWWQAMRDRWPTDPTSYEGMIWAYRALGDVASAAAVAERALQLDSATALVSVPARLSGLLAAGDTARALAFARSNAARVRGTVEEVGWWRTVSRRDWTQHMPDARRLASEPRPRPDSRAQLVLLVDGRLGEAERLMNALVQRAGMQYPPRALLLQARAELELGGSREHAASLAREALAWTMRADLSAPAYARLAERIADVAARAGDRATLAATRRMVRSLDAGRVVRSYRIAGGMLDALEAYSAGRYDEAARLAAAAQAETYFGRSLATVAALEADALERAGHRTAARERRARLIEQPPALENDAETWILLREIALRR